MANTKALAARFSTFVRYSFLLATSYGLLLIALGFHVYDDAAIPPWALFIKEPALFQKDFLAQSLGQGFSERTIAAYLYLPLLDRWGWVVVAHVAFSFLLLAGLERVAYSLLRHASLSWVALWILLPGLFYRHWGSNELYYPSLQVSLLAKALGIWVWAGLLQGWRLVPAAALVSCALIHPSVGWQVGLFALPLALAQRRQALPYMGSLGLVAFQTALVGKQAWPSPADEALWQKVFLEFRMGVHFSLSAFPVSAHLVFGVLWLGALIVSIQKRHPLRWTFVLYGLALGAYVFNYYTFRWTPLWYSQLSRATVWLKPLALFMILSLLKEKCRHFQLTTSHAALLTGLVGFSVWRLGRHPDVGKVFLELFRWAEAPSYQLGACACRALPQGAVLATAPTPSAQSAQFYAQRSSFLRLDAHFRSPDPQAYRKRIQLLYGVDPIEGHPAWQKLRQRGQVYFDSILTHAPHLWQAAGITHVITEGTCYLPYEPLCRAGLLALYELPKPDERPDLKTR